MTVYFCKVHQVGLPLLPLFSPSPPLLSLRHQNQPLLFFLFLCLLSVKSENKNEDIYDDPLPFNE